MAEWWLGPTTPDQCGENPDCTCTDTSMSVPDKVSPGCRITENPKSETLTLFWSSSSMFSGWKRECMCVTSVSMCMYM